MEDLKTSIKIKKLWHSETAADGGTGTNWKEIAVGLREATVQFNGSDADTSNYKNVRGNILESSSVKGDKTLNFQFADLTPAEIAPFVGGLVTEDSDAVTYEAPENENQVIEKSIMFLTEKNLLFVVTRASIDAYPMVNDDDLHYYQINTTILQPEKSGISAYSYSVLKVIDANDITSFDFPDEDVTVPAVITPATHTVTIEVGPPAFDPSAMTPVIGVSLGAAITPNTGETLDFTSPVIYVVEAADGTLQNWTVTVSIQSP